MSIAESLYWGKPVIAQECVPKVPRKKLSAIIWLLQSFSKR